MLIQVEINDKYINYLQKTDIKTYVNELIAKDIYLNSEQYQKDKEKFKNRLKEIEKGNVISHEEIWKEIDEL